MSAMVVVMVPVILSSVGRPPLHPSAAIAAVRADAPSATRVRAAAFRDIGFLSVSASFALVLFAQQAGIKVVHVPFKGAGPAVVAMLGGETDLLFANTGVFLGHLRAGKLRPIAVAAMSRLALFPNVPTLNESGFPKFESSTYYGLLAPAGTPRPIINRLHDEVVKIIKSPESMERLASVGAFAVANTPEQFTQALKLDVEKWARVVKEHGIKAE